MRGVGRVLMFCAEVVIDTLVTLITMFFGGVGEASNPRRRPSAPAFPAESSYGRRERRRTRPRGARGPGE